MSREYARALANFAALTDAKTGLIRRVEVMKLSELDPRVFMAHAEPCDTVPLAGLTASNRGAACSTTPERAIVRACGESVERYCSAFFELRSLRLSSEAELRKADERFLSVHDVYPFHPDQYCDGFPFERVEHDRPLRWVRGQTLSEGKAIWLPASCVYVPYLFDRSVEPFTHMPISTGLAAGPNVEYCVRKGIYEILERDALMLIWYARLQVPRIDVSSCRGRSSAIDLLLASERPNGPTWYLNWLTLDINVPIVSAALIDPRNPPLTSFGIAAHSDPDHALLLALEEAALTRVLVNRSSELMADPNYVHARFNTLRDHLLAHATSSALREELRFLTDEGPVRSFGQLAERGPGPSTRDLIAGARLDGGWVDITTPDVADFGFRVVRTVVRGMQPLDNDHRYRYLGGNRLTTTPAKFGRPGLTRSALNAAPHPFP